MLVDDVDGSGLEVVEVVAVSLLELACLVAVDAGAVWFVERGKLDLKVIAVLVVEETSDGTIAKACEGENLADTDHTEALNRLVRSGE